MYLDAAGNVIKGSTTTGHLAVGVPGTVSGLETALAKYGTMKRADAEAKAVALILPVGAQRAVETKDRDVVALDSKVTIERGGQKQDKLTYLPTASLPPSSGTWAAM